MSNHHFLSYSSVDGLDFSLRLYDLLAAGPPHTRVWMDKRNLSPGRDWDTQITEAIRTCDSLLFVMTRDSVEDQSVCKNEWTRAMAYKKPIVPIRLHRDADMPFRLGSRQDIDFTGVFEPALARLRTHLAWLASPAGELQALRDRLTDAQRDLRRSTEVAQLSRIQGEISQLEADITALSQVVADPHGAERLVEESLARALERERQPHLRARATERSKFLNPPPGLAPAYFQDRQVEANLIGDFLNDASKRLMLVVGRAGIGKTALVCRLLKALELGSLPDDGGPLDVDGIVYLSAIGSHRLNVPTLLADLSKLLPEEIAQSLEGLFRDPKASTEAKVQSLLEFFPRGQVVVLLDNFEDVVEPETLATGDAELGKALQALLTLPHHAVKVILTTRVAPRDVALVQPGRQARVDLDEGLPFPYAENILRAMDADGKVGLREAPGALLGQARERTRGYPRALEALFAILSADRDTTLQEVLDDPALWPENVVEALVGEAFSRLDAC